MTNKILLVDDNEFNCDMLSRRLIKRGFSVEIADNGLAALDKTGGFKPDLILLDLNLPEMSGWEVAQQLKDSPNTRSIPIIALTSYAMASDKVKALKVGCDDFETKPIEFPRLLEKIQKFLILG
jgi:two-component system, cell cycle response regulator DivK